MSLHGVGDIHDEVVRVKGAYAKILVAIQRMQALGFPFRINCTMSKPVVPLLPDIARHAIDLGAYGVNFIAFNPFGDQETGRRRSDTVARYSEVRGPLTVAMDLLEEAGIEVNVRYLPFVWPRIGTGRISIISSNCPMTRTSGTSELDMVHERAADAQGRGRSPPYLLGGPYSRNLQNADSLYVRDHYERAPVVQGVKFAAHRVLTRLVQHWKSLDAVYRDEARFRAEVHCHYAYHEGCAACPARDICDGFHGDYAELFGTGEAQPISGATRIADPLYYIREQEKPWNPKMHPGHSESEDPSMREQHGDTRCKGKIFRGAGRHYCETANRCAAW